ncbi:hypothetical protein BUALT_Bualt18G0065400 [Buddleja alternifolia]|uniref:Disease resistance protein RGA3 n=1 Tax=Buddleja alternifolia TaxID=168488 RepID=A0AAV6W947_9LAMI|nr:hypothetical protein BUALT_Bualt18G0065400 [Buddleja alternifolia]
MADAFVSALAQTVLSNMNSVVIQDIGLAWGLTDELNNLESIFGTIQLVLQDAELKQRKSEAIQNWLRKLKNAAYDAENVLDEIATEGLRRKANSERGMQHELKSFLSLCNPLLFSSKMAHKVKNVREKLDSIAKERLQFHLSEGVVENRFGETLESRQTNSLVNELEIYGRKEGKEMIIEEIVGNGREQDDLSVYAIWGMGGLGKTTLAQLIYNNAKIEKHFELQIWVCVYDDFNTERLVREIIESIQGCGCNVSGSDSLQRLLREKLRGRKFLLVLDDVWNENHNLWNGLKQVLRYGSKGSVLMVTTRIEKVAIMMATITPYNIGNLSEDDSWSLFKQRAFTTEEVNERLVAIGKVIVKKCGGVPLAIKALGSLMRFKSHESEWMEKIQLVQLWMANGFIPSEGQIDLHLAGHLIFKELVSKFPKMLRHLGLDLKSSEAIPENERKLKLPIDDSLRSLIVHGGGTRGFLSFLSKQRYLRVLVMPHHGIRNSPNLLYKLVHLRNLTMSCQNLKKLHESLTCLYNLQTLKLTSSLDLLELPKGLKLMKNLWFLELDVFDSLLCTPPRLGDLTCLRRLSIFIVGQDSSHQINQLKELNLGGNLSIKGLGNVRNLEDAKSANLMAKTDLNSLSLSSRNGINENSAEEVLEGLQPHENLEKMSISSYKGPLQSGAVLEHLDISGCPELQHLPESVRKLSCLGRLSIYACEALRSLPNWLGSLQSLRELHIGGCPRLEKRCKKPNGEDWLTISHIPHIIINRNTVQNLD